MGFRARVLGTTFVLNLQSRLAETKPNAELEVPSSSGNGYTTLGTPPPLAGGYWKSWERSLAGPADVSDEC